MTPPDRPWVAHHSLSTDDAAGLIRRQFPEVRAEGLRRLGSGWEFDAFLTRDRWVFRFPRRGEGSEQLLREARTLDLVRPVLDPVVRVPELELIGDPVPEFPHRFAGHRLIEGVAADRAEVPAPKGLAASLGAALGRLHSLDPERARVVGIGVDENGCRAWTEEAWPVLADLRGLSTAVDEAIEWLAASPPLPDRSPPPHRLVHNDLSPDHVLVDAETGGLVGIIDWTDAALGDPVLDFIFTVTWGGPGFAEDVLDAYATPIDPGFRARLRYLARVLSLIWLGEALEREADVAKHVRRVENAFAG